MSEESPAYEIRDAVVYYDRALALSTSELVVPRGRIMALVGANGAGKSTLLHLMGFVHRPQKGSVRFHGVEITAENAAELQRRVGLMLQEPYLFRGSVQANVEYGLRIRGVRRSQRRDRAKWGMEQVGLAGFERRDARKLSGGEAKRVALARILSLHTDVLLLDEPLAHVDRHSAGLIEQAVMRFNEEQGGTVVLATHDHVWAQALADSVLGLHAGKLAPVSLANVFRGKVTDGGRLFDTGRVIIHIGGGATDETHAAIDPSNIVLSRTVLESSMRNSLLGRIVAIREQSGLIRVDVDAGELFHVSITQESMKLMNLHVSDEIRLSFKSTSAHLF
jgi:molybdopterin-binding protein